MLAIPIKYPPNSMPSPSSVFMLNYQLQKSNQGKTLIRQCNRVKRAAELAGYDRRRTGAFLGLIGMKKNKIIALFFIISCFTKEVSSRVLRLEDRIYVYIINKLTGETIRNGNNRGMVCFTKNIFNSLSPDTFSTICKIGSPRKQCKEPDRLGNCRERIKLIPEDLERSTGSGSACDCLTMALTMGASYGSNIVCVNDQFWEKEQQTISLDKEKGICDLNLTMLHVVIRRENSTSEFQKEVEILKCSNGKIIVSNGAPIYANHTKLNKNHLQSNYNFNPILQLVKRPLEPNFTESCIAGNNNRDSSSMDAPSEDNSSEDVSSKDAASEDGSSKGGSAKNASSKYGYLCLLSISMIPLQSLLWGP